MGIETAVKIAKRLFKYKQLSIPVDIRSILNEYAEVEEVNIPFDGVDGICIYNNGKPNVLINKSSIEVRKRFTLAHELGHLQIPGHIGLISCNTDLNDDPYDSDYQNKEAEANAFASELLMPEAWVISIISRKSINDAVNEIVEKANVSFMAALYRVLNLYNVPFYAIIHNLIDETIKVYYSCRDSLMLYFDNGDYDTDWITYNSVVQNVESPSTKARVFVSKHFLSPNKIEQIANSLTDRTSAQNTFSRIMNYDINWANFFYLLQNYLPYGYIIRITDNNNASRFIKSVNLPLTTYQSDTEEWLNRRAEFHLIFNNSICQVDLWHWKPSEVYYDNGDRTPSKQILERIIDTFVLDKRERNSYLGKVNGIIGNHYSVNKRNPNITPFEFYSALKIKLQRRMDLSFITESDDFDQFLINKTKELYGVSSLK